MIVVSPTLMNSFEIVNPTLTESEISGENFSDQQIGVRGKTLRGTDGREFTNKLENRGEGAGPSGSPRDSRRKTENYQTELIESTDSDRISGRGFPRQLTTGQGDTRISGAEFPFILIYQPVINLLRIPNFGRKNFRSHLFPTGTGGLSDNRK